MIGGVAGIRVHLTGENHYFDPAIGSGNEESFRFMEPKTAICAAEIGSLVNLADVGGLLDGLARIDLHGLESSHGDKDGVRFQHFG